MNFNPENPCPPLDIKNQSDVEKFFELETSHMPRRGYANREDTGFLRPDACAKIELYGYIGKCHPVVPFLAISYHDSFISTRDIPVIIDSDSAEENSGLFILSCFVSAWKMIYPHECDTPAFLIKLKSSYLITDIDAMEHDIDRWLENRNCKRPITSLAFLDFFISSQLIDADKTLVALVKNFATHRAYAQQYNVLYTEYKPSILAATAILYSCTMFYRSDFNIFEDSILESNHLDIKSLQQALRIEKPQVRKIKPETLRKIRDSLEDLSKDFLSISGSADHRPVAHDNKPVKDPSSTYPELQPPFDEDDDDSDDDEPFNERSASHDCAQFRDDELVDDYGPIGKSPPPTSTQLLPDAEPIDAALHREGAGPIQNGMQGAEKFSTNAGTSSSTDRPTTPSRSYESDNTISPSNRPPKKRRLS